jgi:hypothetical protein
MVLELSQAEAPPNQSTLVQRFPPSALVITMLMPPKTQPFG